MYIALYISIERVRLESIFPWYSYVLAASNYTHVYIRCPCGRNRGWTKVGRSSPFGPFVSVSHTIHTHMHTYTYIWSVYSCVRVLIYMEEMYASSPPPPAGHSHAAHPTNSIVHLMYMIIRRGQQRHCRGV